ncbi:MAG: Ferric iron ABC transporter, iron-binding protein, partial [uncultured Acetobacteraceae bacterium]
ARPPPPDRRPLAARRRRRCPRLGAGGEPLLLPPLRQRPRPLRRLHPRNRHPRPADRRRRRPAHRAHPQRGRQQPGRRVHHRGRGAAGARRRRRRPPALPLAVGGAARARRPARRGRHVVRRVPARPRRHVRQAEGSAGGPDALRGFGRPALPRPGLRPRRRAPLQRQPRGLHPRRQRAGADGGVGARRGGQHGPPAARRRPRPVPRHPRWPVPACDRQHLLPRGHRRVGPPGGPIAVQAHRRGVPEPSAGRPRRAREHLRRRAGEDRAQPRRRRALPRIPRHRQGAGDVRAGQHGVPGGGRSAAAPGAPLPRRLPRRAGGRFAHQRARGAGLADHATRGLAL